ncbi:unnamed protein product [Mytilus edulis]|uniref:Uncharacterized protein n=1 Tax=Mytilus edulis TaxID=6550 RepID=A0A8S3T5K0_MYTED|nr:unnamed protein product [Mytilus edulis]
MGTSGTEDISVFMINHWPYCSKTQLKLPRHLIPRHALNIGTSLRNCATIRTRNKQLREDREGLNSCSADTRGKQKEQIKTYSFDLRLQNIERIPCHLMMNIMTIRMTPTIKYRTPRERRATLNQPDYTAKIHPMIMYMPALNLDTSYNVSLEDTDRKLENEEKNLITLMGTNGTEDIFRVYDKSLPILFQNAVKTT